MPQVNDNRIPINNYQNNEHQQYAPEPEPQQPIRRWVNNRINPKTIFCILGIICLLPIIIPLITTFYSLCHWLVSDHKMIAHAIVAVIVVLNILVRL